MRIAGEIEAIGKSSTTFEKSTARVRAASRGQGEQDLACNDELARAWTSTPGGCIDMAGL